LADKGYQGAAPSCALRGWAVDGTDVEERLGAMGKCSKPRTKVRKKSPSAADAVPKVSRLPNDIETLKRMVRELVVELKEARRLSEQKDRKIDELLRRIYGPRSEKVDPNQLRLFAEEFLAQIPPDPDCPLPDAEGKSPKSKPRRKRTSGKLERRQEFHEVPEAERICPCCGDPMPAIRNETSEQMEYQSAVVYIIEHIRPVYACPKGCGSKPAIAPKPPQPIEQSLVGPGLLAHIATSKFGDHQPLYRQQGMLARYGIHVPRSTMCDWMKGAADLAEPVVDLLKAETLASFCVPTDDTGVLVLDRENNRTYRGRLWVYCGDRDHPHLVYDYTPTRERDGPERFFGDYSGYVQADAYSGYDRLFSSGRITEVGCAMHLRRYYVAAVEVDPELPLQAVAMIGHLYDIERAAKKMHAEERYEYRKRYAVPVLDRFEEWMEQIGPFVLPKSPLGDALRYSRNQWQALRRYTEDGRLEIDNGISERALKPGAIGRKNWLFFGSDAGGHRAAKLYTLIGSCTRNKLNPEAYLRFLFRELPRTVHSRLADLTPLAWSAQGCPE